MGDSGSVAAEFHVGQNTQRRLTETLQTEHFSAPPCSSVLHHIFVTVTYSGKVGLFRMHRGMLDAGPAGSQINPLFALRSVRPLY